MSFSSRSNLVGDFRNDRGVWFDYTLTSCPWALNHGLQHEIAMSDGSVRYARVLKTVVHVAVDETDDGSPVLESWKILNHNRYQA